MHTYIQHYLWLVLKTRDELELGILSGIFNRNFCAGKPSLLATPMVYWIIIIKQLFVFPLP